MKQKELILALLALLGLSFSKLNGQMLTANRFGIGFNVGAQKIYCEQPSGFGFGMEAYAKYKLSPRIFTSAALGYGEVSDGTVYYDQSTYYTDLITFDIKVAMNLITEGNAIPYGYIGVGGFLFKYHGPNEDLLPGNVMGRYGDGSLILGGGLELKINPAVALDIYMDYRFTTGDDLNNYHSGANDGYLNFRAGLTYYLPRPLFGGGGSNVKLTNKSPGDEIAGEGVTESPDADLNKLVEGVDSYDEAADANLAVEEYIKLKSRADQLNDAIQQKEREIRELKTQLVARQEKITELEKNLRNRGGALAASLNVDLSDFANSYEQALQHYYSKEYDAAIYLFNMLLETSPTHRLASNCQYWIGECYFGQGDASTALNAFQKVLAYEESFKKDDALLMMGRCYLNLGDKQNALTMFDKLITEYPDSEYYQKAQQYANKL